MDVIKKADISLFGIDDENKNDIKSIYATKIKSSKYPAVTYKSTIVTDDNSVGIMETLPISSLTNGEVYNITKNDKYIIFKTSGSITLKENVNCDILVVGGGGGGSTGGGGAGQVIYKTNQLLTPATYTITVGAGGNGLAPNSAMGGRANDGNDSIIQIGATDVIRAYKGGGAPGNTHLATAPSPPYGSTAGNGINSGGVQNIFPAGNVLGFTGGLGGAGTSYNSAGGGGGAGEKGENGTAGPDATLGSGAIAGRGGNGIQVPITGVNIYYGGGGGGGTNINNATGNTILNRPAGGLGGGGQGSRLANEGGLNAEPNTGGGGGGGDWEATTAGNGGSGVVIIRFKTNEITSSSTLVSGVFNYETTHNLHYANNCNLLVDFDTGKIDVKTLPTTLDTNYVELLNKPTAWYKFDTVNLIEDSSGNGNVLTNNGATFNNSIFIKGNGSALFAPANTTDYKYLTTSSINFDSRSFSISVWIYLTQSTGGIDYWFLTTNRITTVNRTLVIGFTNGPDRIRFGFYGNDLDYVYTISSDVNRWVHWSFIYDSTIPSGNNRFIYKNGVQVSADRTASSLLTPSTNLEIGRWNIGASALFYGYLDDLRIYNGVAITPQEVNILCNNRYIDKSYPLLKDNTGTTINPLVWYKFDDSTNLGLDSRATHNLTNPNGVAFSTDTTKGLGSASFDGTNDSLDNNATFNLNSKDFSISVWMKKTDNSRTDWVLTLGGDSTTFYTLLEVGYIGSNKLRMGFYGNDLDTTGTYNDAGVWTHLVFTYKTGTRNRKIYRNGVEVGSDTAGAELNTNSTLRVGRKFTTEYCKGLMDDLRIYQDKVLTPAEVNELYRGRVEILTTATNKTFYNQTNPYLLLNNTIDNVTYLLTTKPSTFEKKNTKRYLFNIDRNIKQLKLSDKARLAIKSITIPTVISKSYLQSKAINNVIIKMIPIPMDRYISDSSLSSGNPILFSIPLKTNSQGFGVTYNADQNPDKLELAQKPRLNTDNNGYLFINPNPDYLYNFSINQSFLDNGYFEFEVIYDIGEVFQDYVTANTFNFIQETLDYNTDRDNLEGFNINFIITDIDDSGEKVYNEMSLLNKVNRTDILNP